MPPPAHQYPLFGVIVPIVVFGMSMGSPLPRSRLYSVSSVRGEYSECPVTKNSLPPRAITIYTPDSSDSESSVSSFTFRISSRLTSVCRL